MRNYWEDIRQKIAAASSGRLRSDFSKKVGVRPNTVKAWVEQGTVPGIDKLPDISKALGYDDPRELLRPEGSKPTPAAKEPGNAELLAAMAQLQKTNENLQQRLDVLEHGQAGDVVARISAKLRTLSPEALTAIESVIDKTIAKLGSRARGEKTG